MACGTKTTDVLRVLQEALLQDQDAWIPSKGVVEMAAGVLSALVGCVVVSCGTSSAQR